MYHDDGFFQNNCMHWRYTKQCILHICSVFLSYQCLEHPEHRDLFRTSRTQGSILTIQNTGIYFEHPEHRDLFWTSSTQGSILNIHNTGIYFEHPEHRDLFRTSITQGSILNVQNTGIYFEHGVGVNTEIIYTCSYHNHA